MKTKLLIPIMMLLLLIGLATATEVTLGSYKQNECVDLIQVCANCTFVNISSVSLPNSSLILPETDMAQTGTEYRYTFCNTSDLGTYLVYGHGDLDGADTTWGYTFEITTYGQSNQGVSVLAVISSYGLGLLVVLGCSILFMVLSFKVKDDILEILFRILSFIFMVIAVNIGISLLNYFGIVSNNLELAFTILLYGGLFFLVGYYIIMFVKNIFERRRKIKMGEDYNEGS